MWAQHFTQKRARTQTKRETDGQSGIETSRDRQSRTESRDSKRKVETVSDRRVEKVRGRE